MYVTNLKKLQFLKKNPTWPTSAAVRRSGFALFSVFDKQVFPPF